MVAVGFAGIGGGPPRFVAFRRRRSRGATWSIIALPAATPPVRRNLASFHTPRHRRTGGPHVRERGKCWRTNYPFRVGVYWWDFR